ncbi:SusD/RagB family nutrient-binding outer membrane lipoprotein [Rhizosphaericola mali]|nr:SusD/RagB family nutrient-binding outer membrane lipoprotein [Rhizosphaericola mali]
MKKILYIALMIFSSGILFTNCTKNFESINTDPEHITSGSMDYNYLFTAAEMYTAGSDYEAWRNSMIYCSTMIQHLASTQDYWNGDKYTYNAAYNSAYWDRQFPTAVTYIEEVMNKFKGDSANVNLYNITRILRVIIYQRMTDLYGDIPYSNAGKGYLSQITTPSYDKQEDIYTSFFNELDSAAQNLSTSNTNTIGSADLIYEGDPTLWKKLAYSQMLRLAMRMTKVDATNAEKWVKVAVAGGLFESNSDNAIVQHDAVTTAPGNANGLILVYDDPNAYRMSNTLISMLNNTGDPRLHYFATVSTNPGAQWGTSSYNYGDTTSSVQLGMPNGYDQLGGTTDISTATNWPGDINKYSIVNRYTFARLDAPTFILTYAENSLLLAEAAYRGWVDGDASSYYEEGVTAAMEQMTQTGASTGISSAQIATYLAKNPYNSSTALSQINTQYWLATFMDEYEAWSNWRRTGYPTLTQVSYFGNVTGGTIPRRFTYPTTEATSNPTNYTDAISRLSNGDKMTSRMWWDVAQ